MSTPSPKILLVDDDANLLAAFQRNLRKDFSFDTALGGAEALEFVQTRGPYALVLADMNMPGMTGIELLEKIQEISPDTVRMMLTGNADQQTAIEAVNRGQVFRFLNKPSPPEVLIPALQAGLKQAELIRMERELLEGTLSGSVKMLTDILGMIAPDALGRGQRLRDSISRLAQHMHAPGLWELELGALLSSIGSAAVPPTIIQKLESSTPLRVEEAMIICRVPQMGHDLLADIPRLATVADIILYQQKHFDGTGMPTDAIAGEAIPLGARLLKILIDRLDLEADGVVKQRARETMTARQGVYDPHLLNECFVCFPDFLSNTISSSRPVISRHVDELRPGDISVSDVSTKNGSVLVRAGSSMTAAMIARLANFVELGDVKEPILVQQDPDLAKKAGVSPLR